MHILRALVFPLLLLACGGPASSTPPPTSESSESEAAGSETEATTDDSTESASDAPPQCVAMGQPCETNPYCCYGSCRAEDGDPQLLCRP
jgi:hypothetical protein